MYETAALGIGWWAVQENFETIDQFLAGATAGEAPRWPGGWTSDDMAKRVSDRIKYHGVAALIAQSLTPASGWPESLRTSLRREAFARAMWELRHKTLLDELLKCLDERRIDVLILKGTALAYDVYVTPATRQRGDTDLLVAPSQLDDARKVLRDLGYDPSSVEDRHALQEGWSIQSDHSFAHHIDLHWQSFNSHALHTVLPTSACMEASRALPRLGGNARTMSLANTLIHTCVHRAMHIASPYIVKGVHYYGGDRMIWGYDMHLLASRLSEKEWKSFTASAIRFGVARACLAGLSMAQRMFGTRISRSTLRELETAKDERASAYLLDRGQVGRAGDDLSAITGGRAKLAFAVRRILPPSSFMRSKYSDMANAPLIFLYLRRLLEFFQKRTTTR